MSWNVELGGETAIVTGGSRNIGLAVAEAFRSAGARVCVVGLSDRNALDAAVDLLRTQLCDGSGNWTADYVRLRVEASLV